MIKPLASIASNVTIHVGQTKHYLHKSMSKHLNYFKDNKDHGIALAKSQFSNQTYHHYFDKSQL